MRLLTAFLTLLALATPSAAADDPLTRARMLYNQKDYLGAVTAAEQARLVPAFAASADLVAARAYLERFRQSGASDDLTNARERLRRLDPHRLGPVERAEFMVGLGETLYFDGAFSAAAEVFHAVVARGVGLAPDARERALDWWATSVDQDSHARPAAERQTMHGHIRDRMREELASRPDSATAAYWLAASARAQGDLEAAWGAVQAGWVRAVFATDRGAATREDLDRLMTEAILPERAKATSRPPDELRLEWERFKEMWKTE
jgi:hypothetical protein